MTDQTPHTQIPKVPSECLICGSEWRKGYAQPGEIMSKGPIYYGCGASLSCEWLGHDVYKLLIKNCDVKEVEWND